MTPDKIALNAGNPAARAAWRQSGKTQKVRPGNARLGADKTDPLSIKPYCYRPYLRHAYFVKTTLEIPDDLFRRAKAAAALEGISLRQLVTDTLRERLKSSGRKDADPPWMKGFGGLAKLSEETRRIESLIEEEFEQIETEP